MNIHDKSWRDNNPPTDDQAEDMLIIAGLWVMFMVFMATLMFWFGSMV